MKRRTPLAGAALSVPVAWAGGSINQLRWLSETRIDIGRVALTLAQEFRPGLDVEAYSRRLDVLAAAVRSKLGGVIDPVERTLAMRDVLFRDNGFRYDHHPQARKNQRNHLLDGILDTKKGICVTMPLLYVAVGQRLGYPYAILDLSPAEEVHLSRCVSKFKNYNGFSNNCGNPWLECLDDLGITNSRGSPRVLPSEVMEIIRSSPRAIGNTVYQGRRPLYTPSK